MSYAYTNNGFSFRAVDGDYSAQAGEVVFQAVANDEQLATAFPAYAATLLSDAKAAQKAAIDAAYVAAVTANVTFKTAGGITATFQADEGSQKLVMQVTQGYQIAGGTPSGFYWRSADNQNVPFTLADLEGLYTTILAQGWAAFQKRVDLKTAIDAATTVSDVQAIAWA